MLRCDGVWPHIGPQLKTYSPNYQPLTLQNAHPLWIVLQSYCKFFMVRDVVIQMGVKQMHIECPDLQWGRTVRPYPLAPLSVGSAGKIEDRGSEKSEKKVPRIGLAWCGHS